ncbi:hypothetical protein ASE00_04730 [Sphingomonas sp. Root710]|uniref:hypothetical protein n=1 Tax=Sphingomonas sp. Root710 TaxID=1736594 RepID=UPI0006F232FB|nr:hypothetical protein [Sphingomonas sp. Root710]KRB86052.1 hypothetical protein ASE00_04730 [Sphingomonas sp. Root710]
MKFKLGDMISTERPTRFSAELDGAPAVVELDSSAVIKLLDKSQTTALTSALEKRRDRIEAAALRLVRDGFVTTGDDGTLIAVSALDLD